MKPKIIQGAIHTDERGSVSFVNEFKFDTIERFYMITNSPTHPIRAWQGHKLDEKNFYCVQGSFKVSYVLVDNWENPSLNLPVESVILNAKDSKILHIPAGYANAIQSLEEDSKLMSFSTLPLSRVKEDDVRFEAKTWKLDE